MIRIPDVLILLCLNRDAFEFFLRLISDIVCVALHLGGIKRVKFDGPGPQPPRPFIYFRLLYSRCCGFANLLYFL